MIVLRKEDLHDQAGMERAFRWYFAHVDEDPDCHGTFNTMLGARYVDCDFAKRTLVIAVAGQHWMANPGKMLHGGVTASTLDMVMGLLCRYCSGGYMTPTIDLNVNYLRPAPYDRTLCFAAEVTRVGFRICQAVSRVWAEGEEDVVLATAAGSYYVTHKPDPTRSP